VAEIHAGKHHDHKPQEPERLVSAEL